MTVIDRQEEVFFDLTPDGVTISHVWIWAKLANRDDTRVIYDDGEFAFPFNTRSRRYELNDGVLRFQLMQIGGWDADIEKIVVCVIDSDQVIGPEFRPQEVQPIGLAFAGASDGNDTAITLPVGTVAGDFCVFGAQASSSGGSIATPSGFTVHCNYTRSHFGGGTRHLAAWKFLDSSDISAGSIVLDNSGGGAIAGVIGVYRNVHETDPITATLCGTNSGDPEIVCPGPSCHTAAVEGAGVGNISLWGPGFLVPFNIEYEGSMVVYTMGGGSGGGSGFTNTMIAPTSSSFPVTNAEVFLGSGQADSIRVRGAAQMYWLADESLVLPTNPPRWDGTTINYNQGLGSTLILRPKEFN